MEPREALAHLRSFRRGVVLADERPSPMRFVIDGADGRLVAPVEGFVSDAAELVLFLPDESDDAMQLLLIPEPREPDHVTDRYLAYHGDAPTTLWISASVESARLADEVYDGAALTVANPLTGIETPACRRLNADIDRLRDLCSHHANVTPDRPVAVGIDPDGIDVRARFGIIRVPFSPACETPDKVAARLDELLGPGS